MSLALAAKHLAAQGRGNDSMLVHMSPKEVDTLQTVAKAHGGSLTINPHTGLPEAKFLEAILPTVAGLGLAMIPGVGPLAAAGIVGGAQYARTGDINKGLAAGLGAYGGAGIGQGLASAGAQSAGEAAATQAQLQAPGSALPGAAPSSMLASPAPQASLPASAVPSPTAGFQMSPAPPPVSEGAKMAAGLGQVTSSPSAAGSFIGGNKLALGAAGLSTAAGMGAFDAPKPPEQEKGTIRPYEFSSGYTGGAGGGYADYGDQGTAYTGERLWFQPSYKALPTREAAGGGLVALASGGNPSRVKPPPKPKPSATPAPAPVAPAPVAPATGGYRPRPEYEKYPAYTPPMGVPPYGGQPTPPPSYAPAGFAPEMSGQSRDAFAYLMGKLPATPVAPRPQLIGNPTKSISDMGKFTYDPVTQQYTQAPPAMPDFGKGPFSSALAKRWAREHGRAEGGGLESGGFVVPADVVSALGNGSSSAGLELLAKRIGARPIQGPGDGMSDSIPTSIEGKQKAAVARDEAYVPRSQVAKVGGSKRLYEMMDKVRNKAHGKPKQQRKLTNPAKLVP